MLKTLKQIASLSFLAVLVVFGSTGVVQAAQSSSSHFQVNEVQFGSGGDLHDCSANYCAKTSAGETAVGNTKSTNYQAQGGFNTNRTPYIQFMVNAANIDLGVLSTGSTKTATATFSVKTYLSSGYNVITASDPPKNGNKFLTGLTTPTAPATGQEQFGINLVANTSPTTFGANPVQVPSSTFSFGAAAAGYNTANKYKYVKGDVIASSTKSSGETDYTMSYIFNISNTTAGGAYTMQHVLVATSTY